MAIRNIGDVDITLWSEMPEKQLIGSMYKTILIFEHNNLKATVLAWFKHYGGPGGQGFIEEDLV